MLRKGILIIGCLILALPAFGQKVTLREKTWDAYATQRWVDKLSSQRFARNSLIECEDYTSRRDAIMNGNRITTQILNFGSISSPGNTITDIVWNGLGYGYEFGPFVAAEVVDDAGQTIRIVSDGLVSNGGEVSPDGTTFWGWQPIPCAQPVGNFSGIEVVNPNSRLIPTSDEPDKDLDGKPDSWPSSWYNENLKQYVWPGALQQGSSNADKETLYFINDYANNEFNYSPFPSNPEIGGLGLEMETRIYQWANPLAEDAIFLVYKITNKSEKDLDKVIFGMWGDPHIGGPGNWQDDLAFFDKDLNMVFAWDADGRSDIAGRTPGYFGYVFLESPGLGYECLDRNGTEECFDGDGIDNDNDGMTDESWTDGVDNDGDWSAEFDDVGVDGIPGTGDEGEGDGIPTSGDPFDITKPGEPNFEFTDIDESDMIGLTSFASPRFAGTQISNEERVWSLVQPGLFDEVPEEPGDYVFIYGSGSFPLRAGETKRFSIALIMGESFQDLRLNAETVQQIFRVGYRFAKPPNKPKLTAVPGDKKVTLYWDNNAEDSVDPLSRTNDFEGYAIYRSTSHEFSDQQTITDINGSKFLFRPLTNTVGVEAKFDLDNGISGPSPIEYAKRGVSYDLGDDTGLFHTFVDSNNVVNGQTYYYTVVAYDRGFMPEGDGGAFAGGIPPSETSKTITYNPVDDSYIFDVNTASVVPGPNVAGYQSPIIGSDGEISHDSGFATGAITIDVLDPLLVPSDGLYKLSFETINNKTYYSVIDEKEKSVTINAIVGKASPTGFLNIVPESFTLRKGGTVLSEGSDYLLNTTNGAIQVLSGADGDELVATFKYRPIYRSPYLSNEEANPVFDGMHIFLDDVELAINDEETGWVSGGEGIDYEVRVASSGSGRIPQPSDYEVQFESSPVTTSFNTNLPLPFRVINLTQANQQIQTFVPDINRNGAWDINEPVVFVEEINGTTIATWQINFSNTENSIPSGGTVFYIRTHKPFAPRDVFTFTTQGAATDAAMVEEQLRNIYVVPNPYVATNEIEPRNPVSNTQRGDRRLYFANVPAKCTIRIYTLAGELVDTIEHEGDYDNGKAFWDLRTKDNMNIAYGLYLFHVESEEGTVIGKFAVIK